MPLRVIISSEAVLLRRHHPSQRRFYILLSKQHFLSDNDFVLERLGLVIR